VKPFLKWAGGKRQIMNHIQPYIDNYLEVGSKYYEPFVGGGFVFISLERDNCVINDLNEELMNCYKTVKTNPNALIEKLKIHEKLHHENANYFYEIRNLDRNISSYQRMSDVEKAARTIYLNKTCYNGLYRVNRKGFFNTPKGRYKNPNILDADNIIELSNYINKKNVVIKNETFKEAVKDASKGDFLYFDPPYDYEESGFTSYVKEGFTFDDLMELKKVCDKLISKGCKVLISNNATERVLKLFDSKNYSIVAVEDIKYEKEEINVRRYIGSKSSDRKFVKEVLIYGHK